MTKFKTIPKISNKKASRAQTQRFHELTRQILANPKVGSQTKSKHLNSDPRTQGLEIT